MNFTFVRHFTFQIALLGSLCVVLAVCIFGAYTAKQQSEFSERALTKESRNVAREVARLSASFIILQDYISLEKNLLALSGGSSITDVMVTNTAGQVLTHIEQTDGATIARFLGKSLDPPDGGMPTLEFVDDHIVAWHPITQSGVIGWTRARFSLDEARAQKVAIYTRTAIAAFVSSFLCLIILMTFLRPKHQALRKVTDFAAAIDANLGQELKLESSAFEIDLLAQTLNAASRRLAENEASLRASEIRLRTVVENMPVLLVAFNHANRPIAWNRECEKTSGFSADEVFNDPKITEDLARVICANVTILDDDRGIEASIVTKSGDTRIVSWRNISKLFPIQGWAVWCIGLDITDRIASERAKDEFVSTVNHELRTPLTSIRGSLSLLRSGSVGQLPDTALDLVQIAERNSERLTRLITDVLDIQKMEAGELTLHKRPVDIDTLVLDTVQANEAYAHQRNVKLLIESNGETKRVFADNDRIEQVITNLIANAVKFSDPGDTVKVQAQLREDFIRVSVYDNGPGVPDSFRSRIFGRFARADDSTSRAKGGSGLGLYICREIVEQHQGAIDYVSQAGQGTTFYFDLPRFVT